MFLSAILQQTSFNLALAFTLGLILLAWIEVSPVEGHSCSSLAQTLIAESSTIKTLVTPNYPSDYDSDTICSWTIETHQLSDYVVEITFDDFRLESDNTQSCSSDYLAVYDGLTQSASDIIGTFCGFIGSDTKVFSTGRHLTLRFVTNTVFNYRGFELSYFAVPAVSDKKKCFLGNVDNNKLQLKGWSGTFESPRYPMKYPNFMSCLWVITVPEGKRMKLSFQYFDVQWSENCDKDYVKVYDGLNPTSTLMKTLCGASLKLREEIFDSSGRHLIVQFHSDGDNDDNYGFKAQFEEVNPNSKIIGFAGGATVVFLLCFMITCVVIRCRKAKRAANLRLQASSDSVCSSTALTSSQHPYPPPPEEHCEPNGVSSYPPPLDYATSSADALGYTLEPPPPYSYPAESPPPYPGEERAPPYTPPENVYQWQEENQENDLLVSAEEQLL